MSLEGETRKVILGRRRMRVEKNVEKKNRETKITVFKTHQDENNAHSRSFAFIRENHASSY